MKVYFYLKKNIIHDTISKAVLKIEICEKCKISGMLLIFLREIFANTSIL